MKRAVSQSLLCLLLVNTLVGCQHSLDIAAPYDPEDTYTEVYDIRDLVDRPYGEFLRNVYSEDPHALSLLEQDDLVWKLRFLRQPPIFDPTFPEVQEESQALHQQRSELIESIIELIETTVGSQDEWLDETSYLTELNGNFIIKTTRQNHEQIEQLLGNLREQRFAILQKFIRLVETRALLTRARELHLERKYQDAVELLKHAEKLDPDSPVIPAFRQMVEDTAEVVKGSFHHRKR